VGVDISSVVIDEMTLDIREIGASMASKWDSYIPDCSALLFIIDVSDLGMLATSLVLLYEVLSCKHGIRNKPFAIVFNKLDLVSDSSSLAIVYNTLRIEDLIHRYSDSFDLSLLSGVSLEKLSAPQCVREWVRTRVIPHQ
jgi:GTPase involved in cell partitioning and DNA repair